MITLLQHLAEHRQSVFRLLEPKAANCPLKCCQCRFLSVSHGMRISVKTLSQAPEWNIGFKHLHNLPRQRSQLSQLRLITRAKFSILMKTAKRQRRYLQRSLKTKIVPLLVWRCRVCKSQSRILTEQFGCPDG